jgi:hypothetical protein
MLKHIVLSGESARHLINVLAETSYEEVVYIFSAILRLWLECVSIQVQPGFLPESELISSKIFGGTAVMPQIKREKTSYDHEQDHFIRKIADVDNALLNLIKFATEATNESPTMRHGILDAGGLAFVLFAFVSPDFKLPGLVDDLARQGVKRGGVSDNRESSQYQPLSMDAINAEASTLSVLIRSSKFRQTWQSRRFKTRLALCSSLVYSMLEEDGGMDDRHTVARLIFREIIAVHS